VPSPMRYFARFAVFLTAFLLGACGDGSGDKEATQVAAKVNGDEITVHQINQAMHRLGKVPEGQVEQTQKQVLDRLVDQQLLVQKAVEQKLDRDPDVLAAIEASRRQILAQAYIQRVMGGAVKGTDEQITEFYAQHPELFAERRVYRFAQLAIAAPADKQAAVRAKLEELDRQPDKGRILPQFVEWLRSQNLQFRATQTTQGAEQLPLEALPRYHKLNVGDLVFTPSQQGMVVAQLTGVQTQPLNEEQARPYIEQFLQNKERLKLSEHEMKRLREAAKIEYVGDFAALGSEKPAAAAPASTAPTPSGQSADTGKNRDQDATTKGLKSLK